MAKACADADAAMRINVHTLNSQACPSPPRDTAPQILTANQISDLTSTILELS
jgi:hypothetical protein